MGDLIYGRFEVLDSAKPAGPRGMCHAHDRALDRDVDLHWWEPDPADLESALDRLHSWGDAEGRNMGAEVFDDHRLLYLAVPEAGSPSALAALRQLGLFGEDSVAERLAEPTPVVRTATAPQPHSGYWLIWTLLGVTLVGGPALIYWYRATRPAPVIDVFHTDHGLIQRGETLHLEWKVENADEVSISPQPGQVDLQGHWDGQPVANTTYVLTARSSGGSVTGSVPVEVVQGPAPPPATTPSAPAITRFAAEPPEIHAGQNVTLIWHAENATDVRIEGLHHSLKRKLKSDDSVIDSPSSTQRYTLTAAGSGKAATATVTVRVIAPKPASILSFRANPGNIQQCQTTELVWDIENATRIWINGIELPSPRSGRAEVHPLNTTTYELTAEGRAGRPVTQTATVVVSLASHEGPRDCGALVWTGAVGSDGKIFIDATMHQSDPPASKWNGNIPNQNVKVTSEDSYVQVMEQPYVTGQAVIVLSSQRRNASVTVHLWWTHHARGN